MSLMRTILAALTMLLLCTPIEAQRLRRAAVILPPPELPRPSRPVPENGNVWQCWFPGSTIQCRLIRKANASAPGYVAVANQEIDPRLPELVGTLRNYPELLENEIINIPLIGVPFDLSFAGQLAESVMCGNRRDCGVVFSH